MRRLVLVALLLPLAPPVAAATYECAFTPVAIACAYDFDTYEGCEGGSSERATGTTAYLPGAGAHARGFEKCTTTCVPFSGCHASYSNGVSVGATGPFTIVGVTWTVDGRGECHTWVTLVTALPRTQRDAGCPAGPPPALEWGRLLP